MCNNYKYSTEAGLKISLFNFQICQLDEFVEIQKISDKDELKIYNIYLICQRDRISIDPNYIEVNHKTICLNFETYQNLEKVTIPIMIKNVFNTTKIHLKSSTPFDFFELLNENNECLYFNKSAYELDNILFDENREIYPRPSFLDFEILYIGQSLRKSEKPVFDRLKKKHKTLNKIINFKTNNDLNKEIYFVLCSFRMDALIQLKGRVRDSELDIKRFNNYVKKGVELSPKQETTLTEASLIRYFQPKYNIHYKNHFPSKKNKSYSECYDLDINSVSVLIDTELNFFSESIETKKIHEISYSFVNDAERQKLFF